MNIGDIAAYIESRNINRDGVSLGKGLPEADEQYCIENSGGEWAVYYAEKGRRSGLRIFSAESDACEYFVLLVSNDCLLLKEAFERGSG